MGVWSSDAYEGPNRPLESRRGKRTSWSEDLYDAVSALRGLHDMGASTLRGAVKGTLGAPGDIENLIRTADKWSRNEDTSKAVSESVFPNTEEIGKKPWMPAVNPGQKESPFEGVGEVLGLPGVGGAGKAALKVGEKAVEPVVKALRVTSRADTPATAASRRGFLKDVGAGGVVAATGGGLAATEAVVRALRKEAPALEKEGLAVARKVPHVSQRVMDKTHEYHKYEALDDADVWGHAAKPYTSQDLIDIGRIDFPGKSDEEILHIYERFLDAEPGVKSGEWGTKQLPKDTLDKFGKSGYTPATGVWDETEAQIAKDIVDGKINPRDYPKGTFDKFDWGNTDHWDHRHTLNGQVDYDVDIRPVTKDHPQAMSTKDKEEYFKKLDAERIKTPGKSEEYYWKQLNSSAKSDSPSAAMFVAAHALTDPETRRAIKLTEEGKHPDAVWRETRRAPVPTRAEHIPDVSPAERPWMKEIDDSNMSIKQGPHRTPDGRLRTGRYQLSTVIDHPELFKAEPHFKMTKVLIGPDVTAPGVHGSYDIGTNTMRLNSTHLNSADGQNTVQTILHELQHPIQAREGWPEGANTSMFELTPRHKEGLRLMRERGPHTQETSHALDRLDEQVHAEGNDPFYTYQMTLGEQQAEATAKRWPFSHAERGQPPSADYHDLAGAHDSRKTAAMLENALRTYDPVAAAARAKANRTPLHPKHTQNILDMTGGKKSHFDELTEDEIDDFFLKGLDEGIEVK